MSEENVARVKATYEAFNREDFDAVAKTVHPQVEFIRAGGQGAIRGAEALRAWMEPDAFEALTVTPLDFRTKANRVLVRHRNTARGAGSGIEIEGEAWMLWTFGDDGRASRIEAFLEEAPALEAAGLSE